MFLLTCRRLHLTSVLHFGLHFVERNTAFGVQHCVRNVSCSMDVSETPYRGSILLLPTAALIFATAARLLVRNCLNVKKNAHMFTKQSVTRGLFQIGLGGSELSVDFVSGCTRPRSFFFFFFPRSRSLLTILIQCGFCEICSNPWDYRRIIRLQVCGICSHLQFHRLVEIKPLMLGEEA